MPEGVTNGAYLTLGPVLFNWTPEHWRDFYFRIADEAPVDTVCVGEVVCSKRLPFFAPLVPEVVDRLEAAGKEVVLPSLAMVMNDREVKANRALAASADHLIEVNDVSVLPNLNGKAFAVGPFLNVYNEGTLAFLAGKGAVRACLPPELPADAVREIAKAGRDAGVEIELQVYGRIPLALSARCYHARRYGLAKDSCRYVCANDPDGLALETLDGAPFLAVNGIQTLSHTCCNLVGELNNLRQAGVTRFRLSPQDCDMVAVSRIFRSVLDGNLAADEATRALSQIKPDLPFSNGFLKGVEGHKFAGAAFSAP